MTKISKTSFYVADESTYLQESNNFKIYIKLPEQIRDKVRRTKSRHFTHNQINVDTYKSIIKFIRGIAII